VVTVVPVEVGLKEPQVLAGVQLQFTPAVSVVVAAMTAVLPGLAVDKLAGGAVEIVTVIPLPMETAAWAFLVLSLTEVAMMVAEPPAGTVAGALYVAVIGVMAVKLPQAPVGMQLKMTPEFEESLKTETAMGAVRLTFSEAGGALEKETEMGGGGVLLPPPQPTEMNDRQPKMSR